MPEKEEHIFGDAFMLYSKYRWTEMKTDEQWTMLATDVRIFAETYNWRGNPTVFRLAMFILDVMNDLYKDGKKPELPDYFGRSDL